MAGSLMITWKKEQVFKSGHYPFIQNLLEYVFKIILVNEILDLECTKHLIIQNLVSMACVLIALKPLNPLCLLIGLIWTTDTKCINY